MATTDSTTLTRQGETRVVRPLRVLVPLIKEDIQHGRDAAERAGMPYYLAAGEKLIEAKGQMNHGEFLPWVKRHFGVSKVQSAIWMSLASESKSKVHLTFASLSDFKRQTGAPTYNKGPEWHAPVKSVVDRLDTMTLNLKKEELNRAEERDTQRTLALQLIDIGYKVLAKTLHPDKGGSRAAMARLNAVRDRLKSHA